MTTELRRKVLTACGAQPTRLDVWFAVAGEPPCDRYLNTDWEQFGLIFDYLKEQGHEPCLYSGDEHHVAQPSQYYCWTSKSGRTYGDIALDAIVSAAAKALGIPEDPTLT